MNLNDIKTRLTALNESLSDKGYTYPNCDLTVDPNFTRVWVKANAEGAVKNVFEGLEGDNLEGAFSEADKFVRNLKSLHDYRKEQAVRAFGRAVDGMRDAGIEAEFVDPISEKFKALSENLLTHEAAA